MWARAAMDVVDCHCHWFTPKIVASCAARPAMVAQLRLDVDGGGERLDPADLQASAVRNDIARCVLLPTAAPGRVRQINRSHRQAAARHDRLTALNTLHPEMDDPDAEIRDGLERGTRGWKLSSFSQRFALDGAPARAMFAAMEREGGRRGLRPVVVLDTYTRADVHFGADPRHLTTPERLVALAEAHPGLDLVGAHMGGLAADPNELRRALIPAVNLYLDTSNAGHVLPPAVFAALARDHGADHVLFGTDWPWFVHEREIPHVRGLLRRAGFDGEAQRRVFGDNACRLMGL